MKFGTFSTLLCIWSVLDYTNGDPIETKENVNQSDPLMEINYFSIPQTNALYKFYQTPKTLRDAEVTCEDEGANLYFPDTEKESNTVSNFMQNHKGALGYGWYLGIMRVGNTFETLTGIPISHVYTKWSAGDLNNAGGMENCVVYVAVLKRMKLVPCSFQYPFICKSRPRPNERNENCDISASDGDFIEQSYILKQSGALKDYFPIPQIKALYKIYRTPKTFEDAKTTCENEGASLYYPETEEESNAVSSFMQTCKDSNAHGWLLGIVRSGSNFKPINGTTLSKAYIKWNRGEPNNYGGSAEDCVLFIVTLNSMNDVPCSYKFEFICKWQPSEKNQNDHTPNSGGDPIEANENVNQSSTLMDIHYFPIPQTDALYKFYQTPKTFRDAQITCEDEGANLYYPDTEEESNTVSNFMQNYKGALGYGWYLGILRVGNTFGTLTGIPISYVYIKWSTGEPHDAGGEQNCVVYVAALKRMKDVPCSAQYPFICKSRPRPNERNKNCDISASDGDLIEQSDILKQSGALKDYFPIPQIKALYKIYRTPKTFEDAKATCEAEGASLYYPETKEESNAVLTFMQTCKDSNAYGWLLGIVRSGSNFKPINGTSLSKAYLKWNIGEPNNEGLTEDCVIYIASLTSMNDIPCSYEFEFICKWQPSERNQIDHTPNSDAVSVTTEATGNITRSVGLKASNYAYGDAIESNEFVNKRFVLKENDYFSISETEALYKLHRTPKTFEGAKATCEDEGTSLYYPETAKESNAVLTLIEATMGFSPYGWYLGVVRSGSTFKPINGTSMTNMYIEWDRNEPNNAGGGENCVLFIVPRIASNDVPCSYEFEFICKWRPSERIWNNHTSNSDEVSVTTEATANITRSGGLKESTYAYGDMIESNGIVNKRNALKEKYYFSIPETEALYKLHRTPKTFDDAKATCEDEGTSLYFPETATESNAISTIVEHRTAFNPYGWYLGVLRSGSTFKPINGTSISNNMYIEWNVNEPNNAGGAENCVVYIVSLIASNDVPCSYEFEFICKWRPSERIRNNHTSNSDGALTTETTENIMQSSDLGEINYVDGVLTTEKNKNIRQSNDLEVSSYVYRVSSERTTDLNQSKDLEENSYDFIPQTKGLYKLHYTTKTFDEAKKTCEDEGAVLYNPESGDESNAVLTFMKNKYRESLPNKLYLGNVKPASLLETLSGLSISKLYNNWLLREPSNNHTTATCVEFVTSQNLVNDVTCNRQSAFICKRRQSEWNEYCHMSDLDYGYSEEMGKCYKFHLSPKNWTDAQEICRAERSHLAVINSHEEASYLVRLTRSTLRNIPGKFTRGVVLLGFHNNNVRDWKTIEGKSLYYSGYACWGNNQPDGGERDRCGSMFYNGHLNDIACDQQAFFICEHDNAALNYVHEPSSMYNVIQSLRCYDTI